MMALRKSTVPRSDAGSDLRSARRWALQAKASEEKRFVQGIERLPRTAACTTYDESRADRRRIGGKSGVSVSEDTA
jgi:hypothetical protein